jgi:uncharacterized protein DUF4105
METTLERTPLTGATRRLQRVSKTLRRITLTAALLALLCLTYIFLLLQPSNDRTWEFGMDHLPHITIQGSTVQVQDLRDFRYTATGTRSADFIDRVFALDRLERVWFVVEPFTGAPFSGFKGVAHTYFVFDFQDQPPLAISVEARREKDEPYEAFHGLFNQFELIYIWGTEDDLTGRRAVLEKNRLYMYPLTISVEAARELLLQLAQASRQLESHPRFYNTLTSNCTNELANAANRVKPGAIPPNLALVFPGYSNEVLYKLGFIPNDDSLEAIDRRYYVSDLVVANYDRTGFSELVRAALPRP